MRETIESYFQGERNESILFFLVGAFAIAFAIWFWATVKPDFYRGMAWPLLLVGLIQVGVGASVFLRSPSDAKRVNKWTQEEPSKIKLEEVPRMEKVMRNFAYYRYAEMFLMIVGLTLILINKEVGFWKGLGAGLLAQATLMLIADFFAERRGAGYLKALLESQ